MEDELPRVRPPRVHITYPVEAGDPVRDRELPFVIGVLAGLSGGRSAPPLRERKFIQIDRDNFDAVLAHLGPRVETEAGEAAWRGLDYLVHEGEPSSAIKIRVLDATKQELLDDFRATGEIQDSALFRALHDEYCLLGGEPYGVLIGDYEFANTADDLELLERIAAVAASEHAPFLAAPSPSMFGWTGFGEMCGGREMARIFESEAYARWRSFRQTSDAAYTCLVLPRALLRPNVWGNAAWMLAARLAEAFRLYHWCAAIVGVEGGGLVKGQVISTPDGLIGPTDVPIDDIQEKVLADLGFVSLVLCRYSDLAAFFSVPTCLRPKTYADDAATAAARLSASLPFVMAASRFAHYIKVMVRERPPMSREDCEAFLNQWLIDYVCESDDIGQDAKARFPLREGRITVCDEPGRRLAVALLRPCFQLLDLERSLRVVIELPPSYRDRL